MDLRHTIAEHLGMMSTMIYDLNASNSVLIMKHKEIITTYSQLSRHFERHLELKEERQDFQTDPSVYLAESSHHRKSRLKCK